MLEVRAIDVAYGEARILHGVSLSVAAGEILCLLGRNGAGKTTTLKAIMGLLPLRAGSVTLDGERLNDLPAHAVPVRGIGYVPQGRRLFSELSVRENLDIGLRIRARGHATLDAVLELFPRLRERMDQRADTLSGGEQQMLATARALCLEPKILLLDEPTEGLQPSMIELIRDVIARLKARGSAIILVEQRIEAVISLADRVAFLENGRNGETVPVERVRSEPELLQRYIGV